MLPSLKVACSLFLISIHYKKPELWTEELRIESRHSKDDIIKFSGYMNNYLINFQEKYDQRCSYINFSSYKKYTKLLNPLRYEYLLIK